MQRYRKQNTYYSDYIEFSALLYTHLLPVLRGHHAEEEIKPIFLKAHQRIKSATNQPVNPPTNPPTFQPPSNAWIPLWRHPKENRLPTRRKAMPRIWKTSRQLFTNIVYSRPKNSLVICHLSPLHKCQKPRFQILSFDFAPLVPTLPFHIFAITALIFTSSGSKSSRSKGPTLIRIGSPGWGYLF